MTNIDILINGELTVIDPEKNFPSLLEELGYTQSTFAIAINEQFIPRSAYSDVQLKEGDRIELLVPMQGG